MWLNDSLKKEVRKVFEPRYQRKLSDTEVITIADNITEVMETFLMMKWKQKYENEQTQS